MTIGLKKLAAAGVFLIQATALSGAAPIPPETVQSFSAEDVNRIISHFAPIIVLHQDEKYKMDDPSAFLESGNVWLEGAIIKNEDSYTRWVLGKFYSKREKAAFQKDNVKCDDDNKKSLFPTIYNESGFKCYLRWDDATLNEGNQRRAVPLVSLHQQGEALYLTFWFFYPFNGPGRAFLVQEAWSAKQSQYGRHYGDWEHVTLRVIRNPNPNGDFDFSLNAMYLSRHDFSPWYRDFTSFTFQASKNDRNMYQPLIYSAINTHALYPGDIHGGSTHTAEYIYHPLPYSPISIYDEINSRGDQFDTSNPDHRIILSSNVPGVIASPPGWYSFDKRWGGYIGNMIKYKIPKVPEVIPEIPLFFSEVQSAPSGPSQKEGDDIIRFVDQPGALSLASQAVADAPLDLFALAYDKTGKCCDVRHNSRDDGTWDDWSWPLKSGVQAITSCVVRTDSFDTPRSKYDSMTYVFALGNDQSLSFNRLHFAPYSGREWGPGWDTALSIADGFSLIAADYSNPAPRTNNLELFAVRASDGALMHNYMASQSQSWQGWSDQDASLNQAPNGLVSIKTTHDSNGALYVFGLNRSGMVFWTLIVGTEWQNWQSLPGTGPQGRSNTDVVKSFSVSGGDVVELLAIKQDNIVHRNAYNPATASWLAWDDGFQPAVQQGLQAKSVEMVRGSNTEAFLIDPNGKVIHNWKGSSGWNRWENPDSGFPDAPVKVGSINGITDGSGRLRIFAATATKDIDSLDLTNDGWAQGWNMMLFDQSSAMTPK
jgi:hypothetical protein